MVSTLKSLTGSLPTYSQTYFLFSIFLFFFVLVSPQSMWDLSSLTEN